MTKPKPFYWTESGHPHCKHGIILYGTKCTRCERDKIGAIELKPVIPFVGRFA